MQVEDKAGKGKFWSVSVESALLFETPGELFARVLRTLRPSCTFTVDVQFRPFANVRSAARYDGAVLRVRMADVLEQAPAPVLESLAFILLSKLFRLPLAALHRHRYRMWLNRQDVRKRVESSRGQRRYRALDSKGGKHVSLEEIFEDLNMRFFGGMLARPNLGWSRTASRRRLGHYSPTHHVIVLSRVFDDPEAPRELVEYVMYHEMLHLVHPPEHRRSRRVVHTRAFREAERRFPDLMGVKGRLKEFLALAENTSGSSITGA